MPRKRKSAAPTLEEAVDRFLQLDRSPYTNANYRCHLKQLMQTLGAARPVAEISTGEIETWLLEAMRRPRKPIQRSTACAYLRIFKTFFQFCTSHGYIRSSPADIINIRPERQKPGDAESRAVPPDELARMIEAARYSGPRDYALLLFLADTGCRVGGLESLRTDNLDLEKREALLCEKGDKWHRVYFGERTAEALRRWLAMRSPNAPEHVFTTLGELARPISRRAISTVVARLARKAGCSRVWRGHALRHSVGHNLAAHGVPPSVVAAKLGHSSADTTLRFYYPRDTAQVRQVTDSYSLVGNDERPQPSDAPTPVDPKAGPARPAGTVLRFEDYVS